MLQKSWSPVAAIAMALPAAAGTHRDRLLASAYDRAVLAALREATAEIPVQVSYRSDGTGRYFVVLTDPAALRSTMDAMWRAARAGPSDHLVDEAVAAISSDLAFRADLPRSRFERVLNEYLQDRDGAGGAVPAPAPLAGLAADRPRDRGRTSVGTAGLGGRW